MTTRASSAATGNSPAAAARGVPPAVAIPALDRPLTATELERALRGFHSSYYVEHPFHQRMHDGALSTRQLQGWVANRLAYQRAIPRKDAAIVSNCLVPAVRRAWLQRIVDQDGASEGEGGIERWIQLGVAVGVPRESMADERFVVPAVRMAAESYVTFCRTRPWVEAVAASLTELFAPDIMRRRLAALPVHYPWIDAAGYGYFQSRLVQAPRDSQQGLAIVTQWCTALETQRRAFEALQFKIDMLWVMIDAIDNAYRE